MADSVGNRLGPRRTFLYEADDSTVYNISLDDSVSSAIGNDASTDGELPILRASQAFPLKPRYVLLQLADDATVTKKVIVGDADSAIWVANGPTAVNINGVGWIVTTRVGERRSVLKVGAPPAP